jgi:RimJ/RimL family protein N-acetyltransferase
MKNEATTLNRLHHHFARQLGCRPEDLAYGNRQLVTCDPGEEGNAAGPLMPLRALRRENGWVVSVTPEAYSSANVVLQNLPLHQDPLSEPARRSFHESLRRKRLVTFYYYGLELYADEESFRPYHGRAVHRLTLEDLPRLQEAGHPLACQEEAMSQGDVFAIIEGGKVRSYATILRSSDEAWEIAVSTEEPYRGRGYAKSVVSAATEAILQAGRVPIYSCDEFNAASRRVAESLGFRKYADDFVCLRKGRREESPATLSDAEAAG